jgi:Holliday junction resolvase RusA-like endonuclease
MIKLEIPSIPPSVNHAYYTNPWGGRSLSNEGRKYKRETVARIVQSYPTALAKIRKNAPYFIYIRFYFETVENKGWPKKTETRYKSIDVTNRVKLLEDALKDACGIDDSQHMMVLEEKRQGVPERTEVFLWNLQEEHPPIVDLLRL